MRIFERVLFPTDFSRPAGDALAHAISLAEAVGAELDVLHVATLYRVDPGVTETGTPFPEELFESLESRAGTALDELIRPFRDRPVRIQSFVRRGAGPTEAILRFASERGSDLIVMGTHGRSGLGHFLLGSVTEEVARLAACPVLSVRGGLHELSEEVPRRLLVAVDFSVHAEVAEEHAGELARAIGGTIDLVHVVEDPGYPDFYFPVPAERLRQLQEMREEAARRLETRMDRWREAGLAGETEVRIGRPAPEIVTAAEEHAADLVVVGSHGRTGWKRVLLGSVAEGVVRRSFRPVLVVKREAAAPSGPELASLEAAAR